MSIEAKLKISPDAASFSATKRSLDGVGTQLQGLRNQLLGFLGLQQGAEGIAALARMTDAYAGMNARLRIVTNGQAEFNQALAEAKSIAAQYNQPLDDSVKLYTRMLSAVKPLGGGLREASVATRAMAASLKISGATTAESGAAILQFSQAMSAGTLRGEEFNSMADAAPRLLDALASGLGKTKGELKGMAEQGQLTTGMVLAALSRDLVKLEAEAARIPATIGGAYQGLRDALTQYVGKQSEANSSGRVAVTVLKLLADNINIVMGALQGIAALGVAAMLGRAAAGLVAMGAGAGGAAAGVGTLGLAMRGLLVLIGGTTGLVVTVGLLAAAWLGLAEAQDAAAKSSPNYLRSELARAQKELADAPKMTTKGGGETVFGGAALKRYIAELEAKIALQEADAKATANGALRGQRADGINQLQNPAGIKKTEEKNEDRDAIAKRYADERAEYVRDKDLQVAKVRAEGNETQAIALERRKTNTLANMDRARRAELLAYDTRDALTSIAQAKHLYDQQLELLADATQREKTLLQSKFDQGIEGLEAYLQNKARLEQADADQDTQRLRTKMAAEQTALDANTKLLGKAKDANAKKQVQEAIDGNKEAIAKAQADIAIRDRALLDAAKARNDLADQYIAKLRTQAALVADQLAQGMGTETEGSIGARLQRQLKPQLDQEFDLNGDTAQTQALIDLQVRQAILAKREAELQRAIQAVASQEAAYQQDQAQGRATEVQTEAKILALRQAQLPVLAALADRLSALVQSPEERARLLQAQQSVQALGETRTAAVMGLQASARSGFEGMFGDIVSGTKTVKTALADMLASFSSQMLSLIGKRLGAKLFESFGLGRVIDGGIASVASLFGFHSGGIVGAQGASFTRSLPAGTAALAAAFAPRFHAGGIVGLAQNERLAVLEDGEEVLTRSNPRHRFNGGGSGGGNGGVGGVQANVSVVVNGAGGSASAQSTAGADLGRLVQASIDQWALTQRRPGGVLAR